MKTQITLIEEVAPSEVLPKEVIDGTLWNSPPPAQARYRLTDGRIEKADFAGLEKNFWDEEFLEDVDLFFATPGWRLFGDVPGILRNKGYDVKVITQADIETAHREEKRKQEERTRLGREANEKAVGDYKTLLAQLTAGLVETTMQENVFYENAGFEKVSEHGNLANWNSNDGLIRVYVHPSTKEKIVVEFYGNAHRIFCSKERVDRLTAEAVQHSVESPDSYLIATLVLEDSDYSDCYACSHYKIIAADEKLKARAIDNYVMRMLNVELTDDEKQHPHSVDFCWYNENKEICEKLGIVKQVEMAWKMKEAKIKQIIASRA